MSFESSLVWLQPGFLCFGEKPGLWREIERDLVYLWRNSVRAILSFREQEIELDTYLRLGFSAKHIPLADFQAPSRDQIDQCLQVLSEWDAARTPVYMHCYAGLGRSGTIAAAWLIHRGVKPVEAIGTVRRLRPGAIESDSQYNALLEYAAGELF